MFYIIRQQDVNIKSPGFLLVTNIFVATLSLGNGYAPIGVLSFTESSNL